MQIKKYISIILPIYNEEKNIPRISKALEEILLSLQEKINYEIIMVDDGSKDQSWKLIKELSQENSNIKAIRFSRNFGHQVALTAGYDHASGDAIITMDSDMQHPPTLIPKMLDAWQKGNDIVYIQRIKRNDSFLKKITAQLHYKLLDSIAEVKIPQNVADFRLIDKRVLNVLKNSTEKSRYLRGMVAWTGFNYTCLQHDYDERIAGQASYGWKKMFKLAFDGVTGFSIFPLRIAAYVGSFVILSGTAMLFYIVYEAIWLSAHYPLFKWLVTIIYIFIGVLFILLWFLGEYIGRIYEELKGRPLYVSTEKLNVREIYSISNKVSEHIDMKNVLIEKKNNEINDVKIPSN